MKKRVLIIYYSFTQQTRLLIKKFGTGLAEENIVVGFERLIPVESYDFPFKSDYRLFTAMVKTFFRKRSKIRDVSPICYEDWDRIVLAGPTWSYHPSGPILDFLDRYGTKICRGKEIVLIISCRSYWRIHFWSLRRALKRHGVIKLTPLIFVHPIKEPFRFIGLVLQLRGKMIRREKSWFRKHYPGYGHNRTQLEEAYKQGIDLGRELHKISGSHSAQERQA